MAAGTLWLLLRACALSSFIFWLTIDAITEAFAHINVCLWAFRMLQIVENYPDYEIRFHSFLKYRRSESEIYQQFSEVYGKFITLDWPENGLEHLYYEVYYK
ncbi:hypothetical protein Trydic_g16304 [Trypoxylus dichotomus]